MMQDQITKAVAVLREGGVIIFPTDTVWGIGAWIGSHQGIARLYQLKKRDPQKPTALLVGSVEQAQIYGRFDAKALELVKMYWPGALTTIVPATKSVPSEIMNDQQAVGIRWPKMELVDTLCRELPGGIVASSANEAGRKTPVIFSEIDERLLGLVDFVIHEEAPLSGVSSTVVDLTGPQPVIVRQGEILVER